MIDLHVHSTCSDGTVPPHELAAMGRGFYAMALTDHDNCDGVAEFLEAADESGAGGGCIRLAGVELSIKPGEGYGVFHLLGLGVDPSNPRLKELLAWILEGRNRRNRQILERFSSIGIDIPAEEVAQYAKGEILARPHFAKWLMDHGYATSTKTAFETYLSAKSPEATRCYVSRIRPDAKDAFDAIHAAGGAAVMAHPRFWTLNPAALRKGLAELKEAGLDGIEAVYQINEPGETVEHLCVAKELDLCVTAGSDYHGNVKPSVILGMKVDDERKFLEPLFERIEAHRR